MKNSTLKFVLLVSLVLNISILGTAGFLYYRNMESHISPFDTSTKKERFLFEELSLTPDQLRDMKKRALSFHAEIDKRSREIVLKRKDLVSRIRAEQPDKKEIAATVSEISRLQEDIQRIIVSHLLQEKNTLNKEQREKFFDLLEESMAKGNQIGCLSVGRH